MKSCRALLPHLEPLHAGPHNLHLPTPAHPPKNSVYSIHICIYNYIYIYRTLFAAQGTQGHGLGSLVVTDCGGGDGIKTDLGWLLTLLVRAWGDHLRNQFSRQRHCHHPVYFSNR